MTTTSETCAALDSYETLNESLKCKVPNTLSKNDTELLYQDCGTNKPPSQVQFDAAESKVDASQDRPSSTDIGRGITLRKSTRAKTQRTKQYGFRPIPKQKGRRALIFKRTAPYKSAKGVSIPFVSNYTYHRGRYIQIGDIVQMEDIRDPQVAYYAQIYSLITDPYNNEMSAAVYWLLPVPGYNPEWGFNPECFVLGPKDDIPRLLDGMEVICRAPIDYFHLRSGLTPLTPPVATKGFVWTRLRPYAKVKPSSVPTPRPSPTKVTPKKIPRGEKDYDKPIVACDVEDDDEASRSGSSASGESYDNDESEDVIPKEREILSPVISGTITSMRINMETEDHIVEGDVLQMQTTKPEEIADAGNSLHDDYDNNSANVCDDETSIDVKESFRKRRKSREAVEVQPAYDDEYNDEKHGEADDDEKDAVDTTADIVAGSCAVEDAATRLPEHSVVMETPKKLDAQEQCRAQVDFMSPEIITDRAKVVLEKRRKLDMDKPPSRATKNDAGNSGSGAAEKVVAPPCGDSEIRSVCVKALKAVCGCEDLSQTSEESDDDVIPVLSSSRPPGFSLPVNIGDIKKETELMED